MMPDHDNDTRRTIHDYTGSVTLIPNEPKITTRMVLIFVGLWLLWWINMFQINVYGALCCLFDRL